MCGKDYGSASSYRSGFEYFCCNGCKMQYDLLKSQHDAMRAEERAKAAETNCPNCGRIIAANDGVWRKNSHVTGFRGLLTFRKFCTDRCANEYWALHPYKGVHSLENAEVTSSKSLSKVQRLCLMFGYLGVHRFAVGKIASGIIMSILFIQGIVSLITNTYRDTILPTFLIVDVVWWIVDFEKLKSKKFTDKFGHTLREN